MTRTILALNPSLEYIETVSLNIRLSNSAEGKMRSNSAAHGPSLDFSSATILFLFALAFRLIYVLQSADNPLFGFPVVDAHVYDRWATRMVSGHWLWDRVENYMPIYPGFLAVQKLIFGLSPYVNKIFQSVMGALSAVMLAQVATRLWNPKVGLIAGYLIATNWMLVVFESEKYAESFSIFFQSLTIWLLVHQVWRSWAIFAAGLAFALSAGVRANLFLIFPFILGWIIYCHKEWRSKAIKNAALFSIGTLILIGPIVVRNFQLTGVPMLRAQVTWSLYSAIDPEFEGLHPPSGILFQKYMHLPFQAGLRSEAEIERFWAEKTWHILHADPFGVVTNLLKRLLIFLNAREWSQEFDVYAYRGYSWFLSLPWTAFWLIGPFGLLGIIVARPATKNQGLVFLYTLVATVSIFPFKVSDRYRLTFVALLTLFAAFALWKLFTLLQSKNRRFLYGVIPLLGILCLLSWPDWPHLADRKTAREEFFIGMRHEVNGSLNEALGFYEMSMAKYPWDPDSPYRIGRILALHGRTKQAMVYFQEALRREPQFPEVLNEIAKIHLKADNFEQAEALVSKSLKLYPNSKATLRLMAKVQHRKGHLTAELDFLKRAVYESKDPHAAISLAARLIELQKFEEALSWYDSVMHSPRVDKTIRAHAAMLAGITVARHFRDKKRASGYWQMVVDKFADASFWGHPANYLTGALSEAVFRRQLKKSQRLWMEDEYIIGLKHWLEGDLISAGKAFEHSLALGSAPSSSVLNIPRKWIREDLASVRQEENKHR